MNSRFERLFTLADRLFESEFMESVIHEKADISDDEVKSEYNFAVPGKDRDDVSVKRKKNKLYIYVHSDLKKTLVIPRGVNMDNIDVSVAKGVLTIKFEKDLGGEMEELEIS